MPSAPPTGARAPIGQGSPSAFGVFVARPGADPIPPPGAAGSSSMLQRLTVRLAETLSLVDPRRTAGAPANRRLLTKPSTRCSKRPHDNELGDLVVSVSDVIENGETGEGFEVLSALGKGTFGQVFKVRSLVSGDIFALKVIRSRQALRKQAETEVGILQSLCLPDSASGPPTPRETEGGAKAPLAGAPDDAAGRQAKGTDPRSLMVQLHEHFSHREHVCLVFEALGVNLLQLLQQNGCRGLSLSLVRFFSKQLLQALILLRQLGVIHCDLKPDTLLLRRLRSPAIRQSTLEPLVFIGEHPAAEPAVARHQDHRLRLRLLRAAAAHLLLHPVALLPLARGPAQPPVRLRDRHLVARLHRGRVLPRPAPLPGRVRVQPALPHRRDARRERRRE